VGARAQNDEIENGRKGQSQSESGVWGGAGLILLCIATKEAGPNTTEKTKKRHWEGKETIRGKGGRKEELVHH